MGRFSQFFEQTGDAAPTKENAGRFSQFFNKEEEAAKPEPAWYEQAGNFGLDVLRNFNDALTFGLYDDAVGVVDPAMADRMRTDLENSSAPAKIIGTTLGYIPSGLGASAAVAKAVPKLAGNTIPKTIGREMLSSGVISAADDVARDGELDPLGIAFDSGIGGLTGGLFTTAGRLSPTARARVAGNSLSDADKLSAEYIMRSADANGVPLTIPEALSEAAPGRGVPVQRIYDDALQAPKGSQVAQTFEANRTPKMRGIGLDMVRMLGPGASPFDVSAAAEAAILRNRQGVQSAVEPLYDAASVRKAPPSWLAGLSDQPGYMTAFDDVTGDTDLMMELTREWRRLGGKGSLENSTLMQDAVKKRLDEMATQSFEQGRNMKGGIYSRAADSILSIMDKVSPGYEAARLAAASGGQKVSNLEAGPLGQLTTAPSAKGQGNVIFGVDNAVDAGLSKGALDELALQDPKLPRGVLANNIDSAVSTDPGNWAKVALPSPHAKGIAMGFAPDVISDARFRAASLVNPYSGNSLPGHDGGIISPIIATIRNAGKGKIAELMQDPNFIKEFGQMGSVQKVANQAGIGLTTQPAKNRRRKPRNRGED